MPGPSSTPAPVAALANSACSGQEQESQKGYTAGQEQESQNDNTQVSGSATSGRCGHEKEGRDSTSSACDGQKERNEAAASPAGSGQGQATSKDKASSVHDGQGRGEDETGSAPVGTEADSEEEEEPEGEGHTCRMCNVFKPWGDFSPQRHECNKCVSALVSLRKIINRTGMRIWVCGTTTRCKKLLRAYLAHRANLQGFRNELENVHMVNVNLAPAPQPQPQLTESCVAEVESVPANVDHVPSTPPEALPPSPPAAPPADEEPMSSSQETCTEVTVTWTTGQLRTWTRVTRRRSGASSTEMSETGHHRRRIAN